MKYVSQVKHTDFGNKQTYSNQKGNVEARDALEDGTETYTNRNGADNWQGPIVQPRNLDTTQ